MLLLDENAAIGMFFGLLLKVGGLLIGFFVVVRVGYHLFVERARTGWGKFSRFFLLLVTIVIGFLLLLAIIRSL